MPPKNKIQSIEYTERANQYARDVCAGKIPACKWVIAACSRHLRDLEKSESSDYRWEFGGRADKACRFIEALPHVKGRWASSKETLRLSPWQIFVVCCLFGWVDKETGNYRFRVAYICVPRKNGKSILAAAIGLFKLCADREYGAEVYSGATTEKQAWEVFRPAKQMVERTPQLQKAFGVSVNAKSLTILANGSRFEPIIGKPGDGASPSCAIVDEYHEHTSDELFDTMLTGMGARDNPLLLVITTAGSDRSGPCYQLQLDGQKMLEGRVEDDRLFSIIYTIDEKDDWKSPEALVKANPNYGISVSAEFLQEEQKGAIQSARKQNVYQMKHENIWVNAAVAWMNMAAWDRCADPGLRVEQFTGQECWIGLDLASRIDLASKAQIFKRIIDGKEHIYAFCRHYLNEAAVEEARNSHYVGWAHEGRLVITPGSMTDHKWIAGDLVEDAKQFHVLEVDHDPWGAAGMIGFLQADPEWDQGVNFVQIDQTVRLLSPAMKYFEGLVLDGRFHHDGDPILGWAVSNVVCHRDAKDNIFPRKEREENKIDPVIAVLNALAMAMNSDGGAMYDNYKVLAF